MLITKEIHLDNYDFVNTKSNIAELSYGHQSIIIYDDFNFDGKKDIALPYGNDISMDSLLLLYTFTRKMAL